MDQNDSSDTSQPFDKTHSKPSAGLQLRQCVALVGLMGAGKSTIGRRLAARLGADFIDSDEAIVEAADMSIPDIFARYGEAHFRERERKVLERLLNGKSVVMATGGGAFMNQHSRQALLENSHVVWLRASLDILLARCSRRLQDRPLLRQGDPRETLSNLMDIRYPVYAQAHSIVDSIDAPHDEIVNQVFLALKKAQVVL